MSPAIKTFLKAFGGTILGASVAFLGSPSTYSEFGVYTLIAAAVGGLFANWLESLRSRL